MRLRSLSLLLAGSLVLAGPSFADISAEELLDEATKGVQDLGGSLEIGDTSVSGSTTRYENVIYGLGSDDGRITFSIPWLEAEELAGGDALELTSAPEVLAVFSAAEFGETGMRMRLITEGGVVRISGEKGERETEFRATRQQLAIDPFKGPDGTVLQQVLLSFTDVESETDYGAGEGRYASKLRIGDLAIDVNMTDPRGMDTSIDYLINDLTMDATGVISAASFDPVGYAQILESENGMSLDIQTGAVRYNVVTLGSGPSMSMSTRAASSGTQIELGSGDVSYRGTNEAVAIRFSSPQVPIPSIELDADAMNFDFGMPVSKTDGVEAAKLMVQFAGMTVNEAVWSMIDRGKLLPRDPANLTIDMDADVVSFLDLDDPKSFAPGAPPPFAFENVTVKDILLEIAGAKLTAVGEVALDNSGPVPQAKTGAFDINLFGGNALIGKIEQLGLVPPGQIQMGRMFLGMFGRPGAGEDHIVSEIRIDDGAITANGMALGR